MDITNVAIASENYSTNSYTKKGIVLHWMVGEIESCDATFKNPARLASAHFGVGSNGEIHQYVDEAYTAFHAGSTEYNRYYFGIEHAGGQQLADGTRKKPTESCHNASAELVAYLCKKYGITCDRNNIIGHKETGASTQCPGTLDIDLIVQKANLILNGNNMPQPSELDQAKAWMQKVKEKYGITLMTKVDSSPLSRQDFLVILKRYTDYLVKTSADD